MFIFYLLFIFFFSVRFFRVSQIFVICIKSIITVSYCLLLFLIKLILKKRERRYMLLYYYLQKSFRDIKKISTHLQYFVMWYKYNFYWKCLTHHTWRERGWIILQLQVVRFAQVGTCGSRHFDVLIRARLF